MLWSAIFPFGAHRGQLQFTSELKVVDILFSQASTALKVMKFDMALVAASSYDGYAGAAGAGTSAWAFVRNYLVDSATKHYSATDIYVVAEAAYAAGTRGNAIVMGHITGIPKVGSADHDPGDQLRPSMATIGTLAPCTTSPTTLVAGARNRKLVALCVDDATAAVANVWFNGLGIGVDWTNVAVGAD